MVSTNTKIREFQEDFGRYKEEEEERLMQYLAKKYNAPSVKISDIQVNPDALQIIKEVDAREAKMAIYKRLKGVLTVAVNEPKNEKLTEILRTLEERGYTHKFTLASMKTLEQIWMFYKDIVATSAIAPGLLSVANKDLEEKTKQIQSIRSIQQIFSDLKKMSKTRRISKNVEYMIATAVAINASDIHIEPTQHGGIIRYRIDGVLTDVADLEKKEYQQLVTRMKLVSGMKITAKEAQDGGFVVQLPKRTISVRTSVIPEEGGGSFVVRILDPKNIIHDLEKIGLHPATLEVFKKNMRKKDGMILTTGPTGSGKTTTLYSLLNAIKGESVKIITLEDPIEYRLKGVVQTQVNKNYSFMSGLRSILRQDPDVLLIGEIRDDKVAQTAIQAALTGHLVFSTLHTNNALGALHRLGQFNINPQTFSQAINVVTAQRLVRKVCSHCSEHHNVTDKQREKILEMINKFPKTYKEEDLDLKNIRKPGELKKNCQHCTSGYKNRVGVFEVFEVNDEVESTYRKEGGVTALHEVVKSQNLPFMEDDGLWKVLKGITTLEEIERVIGVII